MVLPYIVGAGVLCAAVCFMGEFLVKPGIHHKMFGIRLLLIHLSIFYFLYGLMLLFTGRIVFSAAVTVLVYFILIVINNAKNLWFFLTMTISQMPSDFRDCISRFSE